jgi:putative ABC transport system permease protein
MILVTALTIAVRALVRNRMRTLLTILGITIGIAAVISTVALGQGSAAQIQQQMRNLGDNFIWVENGSANVGGVRSGAMTVAKLTVEDTQAMVADLPALVRCSPNSDGRTQLIHGDLNWNTQYRGVSPDYLLIKAWPVVLGAPFADADVAARSRVVILGQTVVRQLFGDEDPIGATIRIGPLPVTVVGVLQGRGNSTTGQDQDDTLFLPYTTAMHYFKGNTPYIDDAMCSATTNEAIPGTKDSIAILLRDRHHLQEGQPDDFNIRSPEDSIRLQADTANTMELFLSAVASVSLLVGGVGVMNIMLVSVTERTREIGLRMALGARETDVRAQFLAEAAALGVLGGLAGVLVGLASSNGIGQTYGWPMATSSQTIVLSVGFSCAVGLVFGYYPARRAAALDPIEALRLE